LKTYYVLKIPGQELIEVDSTHRY